MENLTRRGVGTGVLSLALAGCASSQYRTDERPGAITSERARRGRLTVPVRIDGSGPFDFVVDSAANASVIANDLAAALGLPQAGRLAMHTLLGREVVEAVYAARLEAGALRAERATLALASPLGLDGAAGLIGTDLLQGLRLDLRFRGARRLRITRSRDLSPGFFGARPARARLVRAVSQRFGGQLMIEARAGNATVLAVLDTGAQVSIANSVLAAAAGATPLLQEGGEREGEVLSPTGRRATATPMLLSGLRFGGLLVRNLPLLVGDFHTFSLWDVADRPALLLGVDVLGAFERVLIDLGRGEVSFEP